MDVLSDNSKVTRFGDNRLPERFWDKVVLEPKSGCWFWTGKVTKSGYGQFNVSGKRVYPHRYILWMSEYPWLEGRSDVFACHKCDTPSCVNPDHLFIGSPSDNVADMMRKGRDYRPNTAGVKNAHAKLTEQNVINIRKLYIYGDESYTSLAKKYGVDRKTIMGIVKGRGWRHLLGDELGL